MNDLTREELLYLHEMIKINKSNKDFIDAFGTFGMKHIQSVQDKIKQSYRARWNHELSDEA